MIFITEFGELIEIDCSVPGQASLGNRSIAGRYKKCRIMPGGELVEVYCSAREQASRGHPGNARRYTNIALGESVPLIAKCCKEIDRELVTVEAVSPSNVIFEVDISARLLEFSTDSKILVTVSDASTIRVFDISRKCCLYVLYGPENRKVNQILVNDDNIYLNGIEGTYPWVWSISAYRKLTLATMASVIIPPNVMTNVHYKFDFERGRVLESAEAGLNLGSTVFCETRPDGPWIERAKGLDSDSLNSFRRYGANGDVRRYEARGYVEAIAGDNVNEDPGVNPVMDVSSWQGLALMSASIRAQTLAELDKPSKVTGNPPAREGVAVLSPSPRFFTPFNDASREQSEEEYDLDCSPINKTWELSES